ncbi:polyprenyl synthetase family protein [Nakamurella sp. PAMC28650]|uniref:polyprenyl synthetase family protein n=1 Tax=Nakamurella sp. PAMC28650 TaxID=2762325 RepID=UPI00164EBCC2|nr:polyprenyl synthetase family protein [Nakamurella sp. PAMC28650]QNK82844.1 polyprenyl synthetase family protein [Nakamurella sp. PAMC28650]
MNAPTVLAGIELADPALAARVATGLARVEEVLEREMSSEFDFVTEAASHLMHAGGKRFRPLFTLVAAGVGPNPESEDIITASAVVELIHLATLYHDDVMDEADLRRGAKSANARWDNSIAILTGDFLFAHASRLVADLGPDAVRIIADTFAELVTGQTRETVGPRAGADPIAHHLTVLDEKTAALIDTCARYAGIFSGASQAETAALRRFGRAVGVAFQISDDIIDVASDESGKTPGTDLREGVPTLPVFYTLADPTSDPRLVELVSGPIDSESELAEAVGLLRASSGLVQARATLDNYASTALDELGNLAPSASRDALVSLTQFVVARTR